MSEMPKAYNPQEVEDKIYKTWEESGFFNPDNLGLPDEAEKFSIAMPPPNVTGVLHLGHALENTLMDTMIRYQRMRGKKAFLIPGTDHAAVATQAKVEKDLVKSGKYKNPREELGREKLLEIIREYSEKSKATILSQIRKMGTSCDWSRLAYTFDAPRSRAVNEVFAKMYSDGLIYRGYRVVNWSVKGQSTCSDDELIYVERPAKLYTFRYSKDSPIPIATTRPETKLGDTAVAVHPEGKWKEYIGETFEVKKFGGSVDLKIKVIGDKNVDPNFGTGALGVTPAHSMIDFEMYEKEGDLAFIKIIGKDGLMTSNAGLEYDGLSVEDARKKIIKWLEENNLLEKEEDVTQNVGTSDRFGDVVEVLPMTQWFVNVNKPIPDKGKSLKDLMREAVTIGHNGDKKQKIKITPDRFEKIYLNWIDNLRDWCISRQVWWGHRIPVWYDLTLEEYERYKDDTKAFGDFLNYTEPARKGIGSKKPSADGKWLQDLDTLDTWFSSGLWTFSTLGWPDKTEDLKNFHPTNWMQMGSELVFFWMARMILMSTYAVDQIPFENVYIHGILRDKDGRKFSKSLGNGIDPIDIINKYGADALRLSSIVGTAPGNDSRFYEEKVEGYRNFVNKLWNISRYIITVGAKDSKNKKDGSMSKNKKLEIRNWKLEIKNLTLADKWILEHLENLKYVVNNAIENYQFSYAIDSDDGIRNFMWDKFADWYLEVSKVQGKNDAVLIYVLENLLKLCHPFIPFVTEQIWQEMGKEKLLMIEGWPKNKGGMESMQTSFGVIQEIIKGIRSIKNENGIALKEKVEVIINIKTGNLTQEEINTIEENRNIIEGLAGLKGLKITGDAKKPKGWVQFDYMVSVYVNIEGSINKEKEVEKTKKEIEILKKYIKTIKNKLDNKRFVDNAPANIVEKEREKFRESEEKLEKLEEKRKSFESLTP